MQYAVRRQDMVVAEHMDLHPPLLNANTQNIKHVSMVEKPVCLAGTKQKFRKQGRAENFRNTISVRWLKRQCVDVDTYTRMHTPKIHTVRDRARANSTPTLCRIYVPQKVFTGHNLFVSMLGCRDEFAEADIQEQEHERRRQLASETFNIYVCYNADSLPLFLPFSFLQIAKPQVEMLSNKWCF